MEFLRCILTKELLTEKNTILYGLGAFDDFFQNLSTNATPNDTIVFVIQPIKDTVDQIMNYYYQVSSKKIVKDFAILFMPEITYEIKVFLKTFFFDIKIYTFQNEAMPVDKDIITLNLPESFKELYSDKERNCLSVMARVLAKIEMLFGRFKYRFIKGDNSKTVNDLLENEEKINFINPQKQPVEIHSCIIMERSCDPIVPFCPNYTYEGLLDEYFGISFGSISVPSSLIPPDTGKGANKVKSTNPYKTNLTKVFINSNIVFYEKIRNMVMAQVVDYVKYLSKDVEKANEMASNKDRTDMASVAATTKRLAKMIKEELPQLKNHIPIIEYINEDRAVPINQERTKFEQLLVVDDPPENLHEFYDNQVARQQDLYNILRLMIIESITRGGIEDYTKIKKDMLLTYGFQKVFLFNNLEKAGLLKGPKDKGNPAMNMQYSKVNDKMNLLNKNFNYSDIQDCSYVGVGYTFIGLKMIESAVNGNWKEISDGLSRIPGYQSFPNFVDEVKQSKKERNFIFAVFLGGVTYAEIEGIRFLNKIKRDTKIIIVTTHIINYKKVFDYFDEGETNDAFSFKACQNNIEEAENKLRKKK
ncbi:MAG: Sec1 family protein [archaeon]|nr:Sec1 family protein [archaeon]